MNWLWSNFDLVWGLTLNHLWLSAVPIVISFIVSIPIGWVANRYRASRATLLTVSGILYAIPSLPLFVAMPALIGTKILDPINVVVALSIYGLALMVRSVAEALGSVDSDVRQSARALGFSGWQRFWQVELPLAGPVLLAGLRVVSVSTVSLVSVGSLIGASSLGNLFIQGSNIGFATEVIVGIVGVVIIALVYDLILVLLGRLAMPWLRASRGRGRDRRVARPRAGAVVES